MVLAGEDGRARLHAYNLAGHQSVDIVGFVTREATAPVEKAMEHLYVVMWQQADVGNPTARLCVYIGGRRPLGVAGRERNMQLSVNLPPSALVLGAQGGRERGGAVPMVTVEMVLSLLQAAVSCTQPVPTWLLTPPLSLLEIPRSTNSGLWAHTGLWGLSRSVRVEVPSASLRCVATDLPPLAAWAAAQCEPEMVVCRSATLSSRLSLAPRSFLGVGWAVSEPNRNHPTQLLFSTGA